MVIMMIKKISIVILSFSILFCGFMSTQKSFSYEYEIILNSDDNRDVINGYIYKEYIINEYNRLINGLDDSLVSSAVINNIERFSMDGSYSKYINGKIVVFIGNATGSIIKGSLKKNSCDNSNIRVKFFFSKFFVK